MKRKLVIVLSLFLMFLSVTYIAYFITSQSSDDDPGKQLADNMQGSDNSDSNNSNSNTNNNEDNDTSDSSNNENTKEEESTPSSEDQETDEVLPSPTKSDNNSTQDETEFIKKGIVISAVYTHPVPETDSSTLTTLKKDAEINIVSETGGWYKLDDDSYVYSGFIKIVN